MSRKDPRRHSRCSDGSRTTPSAASRTISKSSGLRPWTNSAPSSTGTGHVFGRRVQTRPPVLRRASRTSTRAPASQSSAAADRPAAPPPTIRKSARFHGSLRSKADASFLEMRVHVSKHIPRRPRAPRNASCMTRSRANRPTRRSRIRPRPITKGSFSMARARGGESKSGNGGQGMNRAGSSRQNKAGREHGAETAEPRRQADGAAARRRSSRRVFVRRTHKDFRFANQSLRRFETWLSVDSIVEERTREGTAAPTRDSRAAEQVVTDSRANRRDAAPTHRGSAARARGTASRVRDVTDKARMDRVLRARFPGWIRAGLLRTGRRLRRERLPRAGGRLRRPVARLRVSGPGRAGLLVRPRRAGFVASGRGLRRVQRLQLRRRPLLRIRGWTAGLGADGR